MDENRCILRVDGAKEFTSQEVVDYCRDNDIILQVVVAYNYTMQARVEGAISCSKQHSRIALLTAKKPTRFWDDATEDVTIKRNFLWASRNFFGVLETPHDTITCSLRLQVLWRPSVCHLGAESSQNCPVSMHW